jgi:predicted enzyme related to lactoylglutathione lyase
VHGEPGTPYWFELVTRAYEESLAFYRDVFAWDVHTMSDSGEFRYSTLGEGASAAAGVLDAGAFLPEGVPSHWMVYITVADTDAAVKKVGELGGSVIEQPTDTPFGRMAMVADSTGALFRVSQPPAG